MKKITTLATAAIMMALGTASCNKDKGNLSVDFKTLTNFPAQGGERTFTIKSDGEWTITKEAGADWIEFDVTSGEGDAEITVYAERNSVKDLRRTNVSITAKGVKKAVIIPVNQDGALDYAIMASKLMVFGSVPPPARPSSQIVTITNIGTESVTLTQPTATNFAIGTLSTTVLATNGATATFAVRPNAGLSMGNFKETITIIASNNARTTVEAEFTVLPEGTKGFYVGEQSRPLIPGDTVSFPVTTANIANGQTGQITWFLDETGRTPMPGDPRNIVAAISNVSNNAARITVGATSSFSPRANLYFGIKIDGIDSPVITLVVERPPRP